MDRTVGELSRFLIPVLLPIEARKSLKNPYETFMVGTFLGLKRCYSLLEPQLGKVELVHGQMLVSSSYQRVNHSGHFSSPKRL